jgi:hypothetical protein
VGSVVPIQAIILSCGASIRERREANLGFHFLLIGFHIGVHFRQHFFSVGFPIGVLLCLVDFQFGG